MPRVPAARDDLIRAEHAVPGLDLPAAAESSRLVLGKDLGAEVLGPPQVGAVERVLRAVAAADHAPAAEHAPPEVDPHGRGPVRVPSIRPVRSSTARLVVGPELGRPGGIVPDVRRRLVEHAGVDERAAADPRPGEDDDVAQERDPLDSVAPEPRRVQEAAQVPARAREVVRPEAPARLEHGHRVALLRQAQGGHGAAEAAPDDDRVVAPAHSSAGSTSPALPSTRRAARPSSDVGPTFTTAKRGASSGSSATGWTSSVEPTTSTSSASCTRA